MKIAERIKYITPSMTLKVIETAANLRRAGADLVDLGAGEPDFPTPQFIQDAALEAMKSGFTRYTKSSGIDELKEAVCVKLGRDNGLEYSPENILITAGGKQGIYNFFQAFLNPGDKVIVLSPYWVSFPEIVRISDGIPVIVPCLPEDEFQPDPERILKAVDSSTRAIIINSPCNPSGTVFNEEVLKGIAKIADENDLYIVSDECYEAITFDAPHLPIARYVNDKSKVVTVHSLSKTYAMTGWRIGYTAASFEVIKAMNTVQQQSTSCPNSIAQKAAVSALLGDQESVKRMKREYRARRDYILQRSAAIPGFNTHKPEGAFFTFHDISSHIGKRYGGKVIRNSVEMCEYLLESNTVVTIPGTAFGMDKYVRISYAAEMESIKEGFSRIEDSLKNLS